MPSKPLRIAIYSPAFHPRLGGLETVVEVLATELSKLGQEVTVITDTPNEASDTFLFRVLRKPTRWELIKAVRACDVYLLANVSLWGLLPLLLAPKPWIATHHGWYEDFGKTIKPMDKLKRFLTHYASANISVSHAVDRFLNLNGHIIPNPYDSTLFKLHPDVLRERDLIFVGRLVSDKGVDLLLDALHHLAERGIHPNLTVVGSGPELEPLQEQANRLNLLDQVVFAGPRRGEELARLMNAHQVMIVPSRWNEPFGIVALEGIACGCVLIGSEGGGLGEAIGPCGVTYPNLEPKALAMQITRVLSDVELQNSCREAAVEHLLKHEKAKVAADYLNIIKAVDKSLPKANTSLK